MPRQPPLVYIGARKRREGELSQGEQARQDQVSQVFSPLVESIRHLYLQDGCRLNYCMENLGFCGWPIATSAEHPAYRKKKKN